MAYDAGDSVRFIEQFTVTLLICIYLQSFKCAVSNKTIEIHPGSFFVSFSENLYPHRISGKTERTIRSQNADLFDRPMLWVSRLK